MPSRYVRVTKRLGEKLVFWRIDVSVVPTPHFVEGSRMARGRFLVPMLVLGLLMSSQLRAQGTTGTITGRVVDSASQQGIGNVNVVIMGGQRGTLSRDDGGFTLANVPAGSYTVRAS